MNKYSFYLICGAFVCSAILLVSFCSCSDGDYSKDVSSTSVIASDAWVAPYSRDPDSHTEYLEDNDIYFIIDPETGVQYIVYREKVFNAGMGGITPRLRSDGSLYVVDVGGGD